MPEEKTDLDKALEAISAAWEAANDSARAAIIKKVNSGARPLYQAIFGRGVKKQKDDDVTAEGDEEKENSKAWLKKQLADSQAKLAQAGEGKGDPVLKARITELETALGDQKKQHKKELAEEKGKRVSATKSSWLERIRAGLEGHGKIKKKPAKYLFVDEEFQKTIQWDDEGNPKFLDAEGNPMAGDTPDAVLAAFSESARRFVDPDDLLPNTAGAGGGAQNGDAGGSSTSTTGYDPEKVGKEMAAKQKGEGPRNAQAFR
jgi:hypothetical protein